MRRFAGAAMTYRTPPGTRDILPDEMRELRRLEGDLADAFDRFGYGPVSTPTIEYHEVLARGDERGAPAAYRFFDEGGELLAMRTDMTIPIARLVATRFAEAAPPFRLWYIANAYRAIRPQRGQMREFTQAGVELIGAEAPEGTAEMIEVLSAALDAAGLTRAMIGVGATERETLLRLPALRGGPEMLEEARDLGGTAVERATQRLADTHRALAARGVVDRVSLDLGLLRDLGYYTGAIVEVYDPAVGHVLGGGGRYDELMGRFGRPLPAVGFALYLERVHVAQAEEERLAEEGQRQGASSRQELEA
jgi:ATP phosphoribosyltransferase regulatory subunit